VLAISEFIVSTHFSGPAPSPQDAASPLLPHQRSPAPHTPVASDEVQALFNRIAPVYDQFNTWLSLGQHHIWKQMAVDWSEPFAGAVCLDVCCGSGDLTRRLAEAAGPDGTVIGLDFAAAQLQRAEAIASTQVGAAPIQWIQGDALDLPFADHTFDAMTMGYGLRNVVDIPRSLRELWRVLKPGKTAAILDFHRPYNDTIRQLQSWCLTQVVVPLAEQWQVRDDYAYILPSLERFPQGQQQVALAHDAGFDAVHYTTAGGMMGVLVARKSAC